MFVLLSILVGFIKEVPSIVTTFAAVNSLGAADPPEILPSTRSSAMFAILAKVTFESAIFAVVTFESAILLPRK